MYSDSEYAQAVKDLEDHQVDIRREVCKGELQWRIKLKIDGRRGPNLYAPTLVEVWRMWRQARQRRI